MQKDRAKRGSQGKHRDCEGKLVEKTAGPAEEGHSRKMVAADIETS